MNLINQPFQNSIGFNLIDLLQSKEYTDFRFIVAYAKTSGVNRILPYMKEFKENGGTIRAVVGIDQSNTSYEALISLNKICDELYVYHTENLMRTFHVKAYYLGGGDAQWLAVGSNNFTAGGLFSNYEASLCEFVDDQLSSSFLSMFSQYTDETSNCCKRITSELIEELLLYGYIQKEQTLAKHRITEVKARKSRAVAKILFGKDTAIKVSTIPSAKKPATPKKTPAQTAVVPAIKEEQPAENEMNYLIRLVPKAGDRSKQVHFTMDILKNYFCKNPGDQLHLQQIDDIYTPHSLEHRTIVYSQRNKNVKIEVAAAEVLDTSYPSDTTKRPILIFKRVNPSIFEYMLLMEGDDGYTELNNRLTGLKWTHRSLPFEILDTETLLSVWNDCPLI